MIVSCNEGENDMALPMTSSLEFDFTGSPENESYLSDTDENYTDEPKKDNRKENSSSFTTSLLDFSSNSPSVSAVSPKFSPTCSLNSSLNSSPTESNSVSSSASLSQNSVTPSDLKGLKVLVRADLNVPIQNCVVQDVSRIKNMSPTIDFLKKAQAKIILMSHLGKTAPKNDEQSLRNLIKPLEDIYKMPVVFIEDYLSDQAKKTIEETSPNSIILLENLRFYKEEEECDTNFAQKLADLGDFYINEAFSVSHRKHASIYALPKLLPHAFGIAFLREMEVVDSFLSTAKSPRMAIVGGAKLDTKINLLKNLVKKVDKLAVGGGIAGAFLAFLGSTILKLDSHKIFEADVIEIIGNAKEYRCELIFPEDFCALISENNTNSIITANDVKASIFDIGPKSVEKFLKHIRESSTVLWNGPVGLFEQPPFDFGTRSLCEEIGRLTRKGRLMSIVGGGDTTFATNKFGVTKDLSYQSTSGGAFLTYLEGGKMPGISAAVRNVKKLVYR